MQLNKVAEPLGAGAENYDFFGIQQTAVDGFGIDTPAEVLQLKEIPKPDPRDNEVLVKKGNVVQSVLQHA